MFDVGLGTDTVISSNTMNVTYVEGVSVIWIGPMKNDNKHSQIFGNWYFLEMEWIGWLKRNCRNAFTQLSITHTR